MNRITEPAVPGGPTAGPDRAARSGSAAHVVAAGIFLSRISGFLRDIILASFFGTTQYASAFRAALRMPNVIQNLLGEGTLSASFIPVYSKLIERGDTATAGRMAGATFALLLAVAGALSLFGIVMAPVLVSVFLAGFSGELRELTITCTRIIFPMTGVLVLSAWALGVLNSHRRFFVSYTAPVMWNAAIIATAIIFGTRLDLRSLVVALSWGALAGGVLQFLVQLPWILRAQRELKFGWDVRSEHMTTVLRNTAPAIMGRGVVQLSGWVDMFLASFLFTGAVAALGYAQTLYMLPLSLFGMSVAAAQLPELARAGHDDVEAMCRRVSAGLRQMAVFVVPSVIGYIVLGDVIIAALYQRNEFDAADTTLVYFILAAYSIGLFASTATRLYVSALFALHDTRTPARIAVVRVVTSAILGAGFMLMLEPVTIPRFPWLFGLGGMQIGRGAAVLVAGMPTGAVGLAAATAVGAWIEWALVRRAVRGRIGDVSAGRTVLLLTAAAGIAAAATRLLLSLAPDLSNAVVLVFVMGLFGALYFGLAFLFGVTEVGTALKRFRPRRP